ncbi:MAG TPA: cobyric acid synthase [Candidatus Lustribacter sp.]|nr:cobyric acid synthase [Candidatus Lustribacter sp.]
MTQRARGLLVAGTASDAGKSLVTAGICRWLARQGISVAPFKAQNMSNNSMVCPDGAEIGRAQWVQALAAGITPEAALNPVLLKPGSDLRSHVVLMGQPWGDLGSGEWASARRELAQAAYSAFRDLASRYDVVVAEGAGSPAEINLREGDYVNLGLAREMDLPMVVVGDIDRGGVLAAMYGTLAILDPADQAVIAGWVVNKFRGHLGLLEPGLRMLEERTGRPVLGVLPYLPGVWLDSEDSLALAHLPQARPPGPGRLSVAVVRLPRVSNATDIDAVAGEPGVEVVVTTDPRVVAGADLAVIPGSRSTLADLAWLRRTGLADAVAARAAQGRAVLGICGGYQMLAGTIRDPDGVEGSPGAVAEGLGLLPVEVTFAVEKALGTPSTTWRGQPVSGYLIHHGRSTIRWDVTPPGGGARPFLDGVEAGAVFGTMWHGAFECDGFRRAFLAGVSEDAGTGWAPDPGAPAFAQARERMLDTLADAIAEHLDTVALARIIGL